jgi:uncharacterized membrane protein YdjX (TVP38/TMEM64 family)
VESLRSWLNDGAWTSWPLPLTIAVFLVVCAVGVMVLIPKTLFAPAAGALFGLSTGLVVCVVGATIGGWLSFVVGRRIGRERVRGWLFPEDGPTGPSRLHRLITLVRRRKPDAEARRGRELLAGLDARLARDGIVPIMVMRMIPVLPASAVNWGAAATSVRVGHFVVGTALGLVPMTMVQVAAGASLRDGVSIPVIAAVFGGCAVTGVAMYFVQRKKAGAPSADDAPVA